MILSRGRVVIFVMGIFSCGGSAAHISQDGSTPDRPYCAEKEVYRCKANGWSIPDVENGKYHGVVKRNFCGDLHSIRS